MTLDVYGHLFGEEEDRTRSAIEAAFADDPDAIDPRVAGEP